MAAILGFEELRGDFKKALSLCQTTGDLNSLLESYEKSKCNDADKRTAMDQVFRDFLLQLIIESPDKLEEFVTLCIQLCRKQILTPTMPVVLLGDIFDSVTLDKCEKLFSYVENNVIVWKEELFFIACKNNLLRMCNDLLRRLSRSQNTIFCGRILLFLAKFFPFSERSGLNIVSEFNLENLTEFGSESSGSLKESLAAEEDSVIEGKLTINYNLYCKFWALQEYFRSPNTCYNKLQWKTFVAHSQTVLSAFSSYKLENISTSNKSKLASLKSDMREEHYFAKYLTNQKLLELQLADANFRRYVLVQFLILFQYLTCSVKFKLESQELKQEQLDWVKETTAQVHKLLAETPPQGDHFSDAVKRILAREEYWNKWKNDGCPEVKKPKRPAEGDEKKKGKKKAKLLGDIVKEYESQGKHYLGSQELSKLWNINRDNMSACKDNARDFMPAMEEYLLSGDTNRASNGAWGWRALRLLASKSPHFFTYSNIPIAGLPTYLDDMIRRLNREVASRKALEAVDLTDGKQQAIKQEEADEVTEEQMESDLIKQDDQNELEQVPDSTGGTESSPERASRPQPVPVTSQLIEEAALKLGSEWRKLGRKLGYKEDELDYMETENASDFLRGQKLLSLWFDDDEDASVENLAYICEGLELTDVHHYLANRTNNGTN